MIYSVISCFQFLQVTLKHFFYPVQNGNIGLKYQKFSKTPVFHNYILIFFSPEMKSAEETLTMVMITIENEVNNFGGVCKS